MIGAIDDINAKKKKLESIPTNGKKRLIRIVILWEIYVGMNSEKKKVCFVLCLLSCYLCVFWD